MKTEMIGRIKKIYEDGGNIIKYLKQLEHRGYNTTEDIMISYDFQAGTYNANYARNPKIYEAVCTQIRENLECYIQTLNLRGGTAYLKREWARGLHLDSL